MAVKQQVLNLLLDYPNATYDKIGSIVHCSKQRVHQIAKSAGLTRNRRAPHYRSDVTVEKVLELYHRDLLVQEIASTLGCCQDTVTARLRQAGISKSECFSRGMKLTRRGKAHYRDDITVDRVLNLYHNELLIKEIAQTLGCNPTTVRRRLRQAGISKSECYSRGRRRRKQESTQNVPIVSFLEEVMRHRKRIPCQLAADLGVSHTTVSRWLSGADIPSTKSCRRLAEYSGVPLEKVLSIVGHLPEIDEDVITMVEDILEHPPKKLKRKSG